MTTGGKTKSKAVKRGRASDFDHYLSGFFWL
jgi:hypothetical protein